MTIAVVALAGAGVLAFVGFRSQGGGDIVLYADDVAAAAPPSTVAPLTASPPATTTSEGTTTGDGTAPEVASAPPTPAEAPVAADSSSDGSGAATFATENEVFVGPRPEPVGLEIGSINVSGHPVRDVGLEDDGQLEIPDETEIGWYKYGASAGQPGSTVLAAHVNWNGSQGPFAQLGRVEPGDEIEVALDDGTTRDYVVTERTMYGKLELPRDRIWRRTGPEELVLITCGGEFNPQIRRFKSNIVVYAAPVG